MVERLAKTTFETGIQDKLATVDVYTQTTATDPIDALLETVGIDIDDIGKLLGGLTGVPAVLIDFFNGTGTSGGTGTLGGTGVFTNGFSIALNDALVDISSNISFVNYLTTVMKDIGTKGVPALTDYEFALDGLQNVVFPENFQDIEAMATIGKYMLSAAGPLNVRKSYAILLNSLKNHPNVQVDVTKSLLITTAQTPDVGMLEELANSSFVDQLKTLNPSFISDFIGNFKLPVGTTPAQYQEIGSRITSSFTKINPNWNKTLRSDGTYSNDSTALSAASNDFKILMGTASASTSVPLASRTTTTEQLVIPVGQDSIDFTYPSNATVGVYVTVGNVRTREITLIDGTKITESTDSSLKTVTRVYAWASTSSTVVPTVGGSGTPEVPATFRWGDTTTFNEEVVYYGNSQFSRGGILAISASLFPPTGYMQFDEWAQFLSATPPGTPFNNGGGHWNEWSTPGSRALYAFNKRESELNTAHIEATSGGGGVVGVGPFSPTAQSSLANTGVAGVVGVGPFSTTSENTPISGGVVVGGGLVVVGNQPTIPRGLMVSDQTQTTSGFEGSASLKTPVTYHNAQDGSLFTLLNPNTGGFTLTTVGPGQVTTVTTSVPIDLPTTVVAGDPLASTSLAISQNPLVLGHVIDQLSNATNTNKNPFITMDADEALKRTFWEQPWASKLIDDERR